MPRLFILGDPNHWHSQQLIRAAEQSRHPRPFKSISVHSFEKLNVTVGGDNCSVKIGENLLSKKDTVLIRQMPKGTLQQIIFRMNALHAACSIGANIQNPPKTLELSIDKFHLLASLSGMGIPILRTKVAQTMEQGLRDYRELGGDTVIKPLFGGRGRGIERIQTRGRAEVCFEEILRAEGILYQQPFVKHPGWDVRILVVGQELFAIKRKNLNDWRTNLSLGGQAAAHNLSQQETNYCRKIQKEIGGQVLAIDFLYDQKGNMFLLEVNGVPGWRGLQDCLQLDVSKKVIESIFPEPAGA